MAQHDAPDRMNMPQGSKQQMGWQNVHKAPGQSQLNKTDTGGLERNDPTQTRPVGRPHMVQHGVLDRTMPQGIKWKMGRLNMHKAPRRSQLSKTDTGALKRNDPASHSYGHPQMK